ncbi:MAG: aspartate kinase [Pseudanabaenaceae cyanobacterium SKYGB_i_bin29]|nr:aspartate kinase [Pseudanabaenaceae cyanobacterium SKYG29]MDW8421491.1 aspartate kinase [Pseudanabaenaceae cyanobacterium SKYGB_i_bin29]
MGLVVQKFGGTSVADGERILQVCRRINQAVSQGEQVVVVVSAMGKTTDSLIDLARSVAGECPDPREMDLLLATGEQVTTALVSMALQAQGQPAIGLTGREAGIITEPHHQRARIISIDVTRIKAELHQGKVVVVTGFQGISTTGEVTTLGRGGSDTSAVALAAALLADRCEIYTDVPGILTTDPRLVPQASLLAEITAAEMLELASLGAKVLHPRAVEIARNFAVPLVVRSTWSEAPGTKILSPAAPSGDLNSLEVNRLVDGIHIDRCQAKVALLGVPDRPGIAARLFSALAEAGILVDLIVQAIQHPLNYNDIAFTVPRPDLDRALAVCRALHPSVTILGDEQISIVSISGVGIVGRPAIPARMFSALGQKDINIEMISTSETKVSCVIAEGDSDRALAALGEIFHLEPTPALLPAADAPTVRGVALDQNQTRLAVLNVPDRPGVAARLLQSLADKGIPLDMIIQSEPAQGLNNIAFTINSTDRYAAERTLQQTAQQLNCGEVLVDTEVAKLSIVGMGMAQAKGIAARMFQALAEQEINIEMIATSEIKVSCIIRQRQAVIGLRAVHQAFGLDGSQVIPIERS